MYASPGPRVEMHEIPDGHEGIEATIGYMRQLAREGARARPVEALAAQLAGGRSGEGAALAIRRLLEQRVRFQFDPPGLELIRAPALMVRQLERNGSAAGDCDDVAVLGAALGMAAGLAARYVLVGFDPRAPYEHVFTELLTGDGRRVELDITRPAQFPPGLEVRRIGYREA